ncbi:hypothetical protein [Bremerella sp. P1]|uniref:hypothetical protein n=1 Tax=Bremerella sp. P1 TaxID=3026424 RepID=UPI002368921F|nr:hypothetical protein [Bremerella sp. P1]WDI43196.1 hypothetical protein PSR63_04455 [Bremerella sp. P1]
MKNQFSPGDRFTWCWIVLGCVSSGSVATAQEPMAQPSSYVAATVLDEEIRLRVISPAEVEHNRSKLSEKDFARWQADSRWRPLVSKVSHRVMSDWAKQNDVQPTREEIQKHFTDEARQHLQAYDTPATKKQLAVAMGWAIATSSEWATAKALHEKYGGPIAISSFGGCIAIEGRNQLVKEYAAAGKIRFTDPELEKLFWEGLENPSVLDVTIREPERVANHFKRLPWQGWGMRTAKWMEENADLLKGLDTEPQDKADAPSDK